MIFSHAFFQTIILLGALQGFIVSSLLFFSKRPGQANKILGAFILLISLACFNLYASYKNWFGSDILRFIADIVPLVIVMPFGPLIYFYTRATLDPSFKLTKKQRIHFYPVVIDLVPSAAVIIFIIGIICRVFKNNPAPWGNFIDTYNVYADIPRWVSVSTYLLLSSRYLKNARLHKKAEVSDAAYKWLRQFVRVLFVFQCIWLIYLVPYVIPKYSDKLLDWVDWYPVYIPMVIIIYWLGLKGFMIVQQQGFVVKKDTAPQTVLSPAIVQQAINVLQTCMQEKKLYLNPQLNLSLLAQETGLPQKTISAVLNQHLYKSFNEFVNEYRVEAFKDKIQQTGFENLTIAGLAYECGFNSQATFQRTFKDMTGMPPSEFRKTIAQVQ